MSAGVVPDGWEEDDDAWAAGAEAPPLSPVVEPVVPAVMVCEAMFGDKEGGMVVKRMTVSNGSSVSESVSVGSESASSSSVRS